LIISGSVEHDDGPRVHGGFGFLVGDIPAIQHHHVIV